MSESREEAARAMRNSESARRSPLGDRLFSFLGLPNSSVFATLIALRSSSPLLASSVFAAFSALSAIFPSVQNLKADKTPGFSKFLRSWEAFPPLHVLKFFKVLHCIPRSQICASFFIFCEILSFLKKSSASLNFLSFCEVLNFLKILEFFTKFWSFSQVFKSILNS